MQDILFVLGNDKIGRKMFNALPTEATIYLDKSSSLKRVIKLILNKRILFFDFLKMCQAEILRNNHSIETDNVIKNNTDFSRVLDLLKPKVVILFRAGLIVSPKILKRDILFLNCHYCTVPKWGGISSISRAIRAGDYKQFACLHYIETSIDTGKVVKKIPYMLNPKDSYLNNENRASDAGVKLLKEFVENEDVSKLSAS